MALDWDKIIIIDEENVVEGEEESVMIFASGIPGHSATIDEVTAETLPPDADAFVENRGNNENARFHFGIPRGEKGEPGSQWGGIGGDIADQTDLAEILTGKANVGESYTKTEEDALLDDKADVDYVDEELGNKVNKANVTSYIESSTTATRDYSVGDYIYINNFLFRVTAPISTGDTINPLINAEMVKIGTELKRKADTDDVYTKEEADYQLDDKLDARDTELSGSVVTFEAENDHAIKDLTVAIEPMQAGTGDPSPDNIRPISGWTGANIYRSGKCLISGTDLATMILANGNDSTRWFPDAEGGAYYSLYNGSVARNKIYINNCFKENTQYTIVLTCEKTSTTYTGTNIRLYYTDGTGISFGLSEPATKEKIIYVSTQGKTISYIGGTNSNTSLTRLYVDESGVYEGVLTEQELEPYVGDVLSVDFPVSEIAPDGIYYSGTVDVLAGMLTVTKGLAVMNGTETWSMANGGFYCDTVLPSNYTLLSEYDFVCNKYTVSSSISNSSAITDKPNNTIFNQKGVETSRRYYRVWIKDTTYSSVDTFIASLSANPVQLLYTLPSSQTYLLTPSQLSTLLGENNIWADTGNSTVTLRLPTGDLAYQDTVDYESQVTNKPDFAAMLSGSETAMVATRNYDEGALIGVGDDLYKALTGIGTGMALVVGSNVVATTIEAEINAGLDTKPNSADVYTKTETDAMLVFKTPYIENTVSGDLVTLTDGADDIPIRDLKINFGIEQEGSGTPSPDNVRQVIDFTNVNIALSYKNWLPAAPAGTWTQDGITFTSDGNGGYTYIGKSTAETYFILDVREYILPTSGYLHLMNSSNSNFISFGFAYDGTVLDPLYSFSAGNRRIQINSGQAGMKANQIVFKVGNNINVTAIRTFSPMVLETNEITPFIPNAKTIGYDWENEAGSICMGTLDVLNGILEVPVTRTITLGADSVFEAVKGLTGNFSWKPSGNGNNALSGLHGACTHYNYIGTVAQSSSVTRDLSVGIHAILSSIYIKDTRFETADALNAYLAAQEANGTPVQIVYQKTDDPSFCQFDPVKVSTAYGENHFWTDTGEVEVTYRSDTKLYIEKRLSELINQ